MSDGKLYIRVYWEDTDAGGVVYHASYLRFMERGRTELLRGKGIDQSTLHRDGLVFVVTRMDIRFRQPARLDDQLTIETALKEIGGASLSLVQRVMRDGNLLAEADVTCAAMSAETGRAMRIPADLKARLGNAWGNTSNA